MKKNKFPIYLIILLLVYVMSNLECSSKEVESGTAELVPVNKIKIESKTRPFKISLSRGGGFTGLKSGYTLFSEGRINHWKQLNRVKDTVYSSQQIDSSKIIWFQEELERTGIFGKTYSGTGNITSYLKYETNDTTYLWSWQGAGISGNIPNELIDWYEKVTKFNSELNK